MELGMEEWCGESGMVEFGGGGGGQVGRSGGEGTAGIGRSGMVIGGGNILFGGCGV